LTKQVWDENKNLLCQNFARVFSQAQGMFEVHPGPEVDFLTL